MCRNTPISSVSRADGIVNEIAKKGKNKFSTETIISQNLRGLKSDARLEELFLALKLRDIFAVCVQETWRHGQQTLEHGECLLILSGLPENQMRSNRGEQGVGIVLSPQAVSAWEEGGKILHDDFGGRMIAIRLIVNDAKKRSVGLFLVSAYAPVGNADQSEWDAYFDLLNVCVARKHKDDILLIGTDANSSLGVVKREGQESMTAVGPHGNHHVNNAGLRFRTFLEVNSYTALTTYFKKKSYSTWTHPRSKKPHQIDHFLSDKIHFSRFTDAGLADPLLDSDHLAIMCKLRIAAKLKKRTPDIRQKILHLDATILKDKENCKKFCNTVANNYASSSNVDDKYSKLSQAISDAAVNSLPKKPKAQPGWFKAEEKNFLKLINIRNEAMKEALSHPTRSYRKKLRVARKNVKVAIAKAKNNWILAKCDELNASSTVKGTAGCWKALKEIKNGLTKTRPKVVKMMTKSDGSMCKNGEENAEVFRIHFEKLFDREPDFNVDAASWIEQSPVLLEYDDIPDDEEIMKAASTLKNKAPGSSGLLPQFWKALIEDETTYTILKEIILDFWESEKPPKQWLYGLLKILPKKGDLSLPGNYRGIMLLEAAYKIITILLLNRLQPISEGLDQEQQCGFRPGRGCNDAIFTVKMSIKKRREHSQSTWVLFLDLVKAFDRVPRQLLWDLLTRFGVPPKLVRLLRALHEDVLVKFEVEGFSHEVKCLIGVKQGDVLGPVLFTIFMVGVMKSWREKYDRPVCMFRSAEDFKTTGRKPNANGESYCVDDSEYADDTAVLFVSLASTETCSLLHFRDY